MGNEYDLIKGFAESETERIAEHLDRLLKYLNSEDFVVVGGLAIRYHLQKAGIEYPRRAFNDLDIIAKYKSVVPTSISEDFLIYHYHPQDTYWALVDPESKIKVDIFNYDPDPKKTIRVNFGKRSIQVVSVEDQLVKSVLDIQRISEELKVDPKQFLDTRLLMQIADMQEADNFWRSREYTQYPESIVSAIERAEKISKEHPDWLKEKPFKEPRPYDCKECRNQDGFTIVPMEEVYRILGFIE